MTNRTDLTIGIDLGTTYSCAAYLKDGKPRIIPSDKGYTTVPSVVGLTQKGDLVVGQPAMDQMVTKPGETIYGAKRFIGRKFNSLVVQKMKEFMTYPIVEGDKGEASVLLGGQVYSLPKISSLILAELREISQGQLQKEVRRAVITVPAYYNDNQRQAVKEAGTLAGFVVERIVNEPTAAAIAYGFNKGFDQRILVYDLGGGTFDVSVLKVHKNEFEVLATGGDTFLGGVDFDNRVATYVLEKFKEATGKDIREEKVAMQRLRSASERAKRDLSSEKDVSIHLPYITDINGEPIDLKLALSREQLNKLTMDLVDRTLRMCEDVLKSVGIKHSDLNEILVVGGQTRMPLVQNKIHQHFGKAPRKGVHPDEAVALGAAILGGGTETQTLVKLKDVLAIPIGVALPNGKFKVILDRNTALPATKVFKMSNAKSETLEIDIYQGEKGDILENEYLGSFEFPAAKGKKGRNLELRFDLSAECLLSVRARDVDTGDQTTMKMVTLQTPKSLKDSLAQAVSQPETKNQKWFMSFAQRILGKSK